MKRLLLASVVSSVALIATATAGLASSTANAEQHPIGGSGIHGDIHFTDTGSTLIVDGTATGLTPGKPYFSLIYTVGVGPGGISENKTVPGDAIAACNDLNRQGQSAITPTQMVIGLWHNNNDGTGVLHDVKSRAPIGNSQDPLFLALGLQPLLAQFGVVLFGNSYAPLDGSWRTVSIRDASNNFALVACGLVQIP